MTANPDSTAIAVLQHQQKTTEETLREIQRTVTEGFASVNVKMDRVNELALGMSQLQTRLEAQNDGLIRAFASIENVEREYKIADHDHLQWRSAFSLDVDGRFAQRDAFRERYIETQTKANAAVERRLDVARGAMLALTAVGGMVLGMIFWNVSAWINEVQGNGDVLQQQQIDIDRLKRTP